MWTIIVAIVIGFIAGLIARAIHPGNDKAGFIMTTLLGIAGSLLATFAGRMIASVIGAVIILFIYNMLTKRRTV